MRRVGRWLCFGIAIGVNAAAAAFAAEGGERIRAGFLKPQDASVIEPAAKAGCNTLILALDVRVPAPAELEPTMARWARACAQHELDLWVSFTLFSAREPKWVGRYRPFVDAEGKRHPNTPCPLDEDFWQRTVAARYDLLADLARKHDLAGILIDPEMYGADFSLYRQPCHCATCSAAAADKLDEQAEEGAASRWSDGNRALRAQRAALRDTIREWMAASRERVAQRAPGVQLGGFHIDQQTPFAEGLLLGMGTEEQPAYIFSQRTYQFGYTPNVQKIQQQVQRLGASAKLVCGLWQRKFTPEALAAHAYHCARDSAGYWIYTFETFSRPEYSPLPKPASEYWAALRRANEELGRLARDGRYATKLEVEPHRLPPQDVNPRAARRLDLRPLRPGDGGAVPPVRLRKQNVLYFHADAGARMAFELDFDQLGRYADSGRAVIVSPRQRPLKQVDLMDPDEDAVEISTTARVAGVHALVVNTGLNAVVVETSQPYAIAANEGAPARFSHIIPTLYVLAKPGAREIRLRLETDTAGERVNAVFSDGDTTLQEEIIVGPEEVAVRLPAGRRVLQIDIEKVPGAGKQDLLVTVLDGAYPYVAPTTAGLLTP
jgi:hypothetical protein